MMNTYQNILKHHKNINKIDKEINQRYRRIGIVNQSMIRSE